MARIRTIKPEFWTDGSIIECSVNARLMFIGTWNFADDEGNLDRSAKQIKARIFPADQIDCEPLIQELITHGLIIEYSVNGKKYLHILGFKTHQLINRPGKAQCPIYDESLNVQGVITEPSQPEGKGMEGKGKDKAIATGKPDCPHQEIIALYHEILPTSPQIRDWTPARAASLKARWNEGADRQTLEYWRKLFEYIAGQPFLTGKVVSNGRKPFFLTLDWLVKAENFAKVREGRYEGTAT